MEYLTARTRYIRKIPQETAQSVPVQERRNEATLHLFLAENWKLRIPTSLAVACGTLSFVLHDSDISIWPASVRFFLPLAFAYLCFMARLKDFTGYLIRFALGFFVIYLFFSFIFFNLDSAEWAVWTRFHTIWISEVIACIWSFLSLYKTDFESKNDFLILYLFLSIINYGVTSSLIFRGTASCCIRPFLLSESQPRGPLPLRISKHPCDR